MEASTRNELADWILHLQNEELLSTLILIKESTEDEDWYATLTKTQKDSIKRGIKDQQSGRTLSSEDFWKKHDPK